MTDKQPEALRLADELESEWFADYDIQNAADELRRLHEVNQVLLEGLKGLDEAYCRSGAPLTKEDRQEDRMRLIKARAAIAKAEVTK
jgi:hypothetical protein